jgi:hypothetical protein
MHVHFSFFFLIPADLFSFLSRYIGPPSCWQTRKGVVLRFSRAPAAPFRSPTRGARRFVFFFFLSFSFCSLTATPLSCRPSSRCPRPRLFALPSSCLPRHVTSVASPLVMHHPSSRHPCHDTSVVSPCRVTPCHVLPSPSSCHPGCAPPHWPRICSGNGGL